MHRIVLTVDVVLFQNFIAVPNQVVSVHFQVCTLNSELHHSLLLSIAAQSEESSM